MAKVYTGRGDNGKTRGLDGSELSKNDPAIRLSGDADELCAHLGLVKAMVDDNGIREFIEAIQKNVGKIMAHVSDPTNTEYIIADEDVAALEQEIDRLSPNIPNGFKLPGRSVLDAQIHIARTVARRTERQFFATGDICSLCPVVGTYLNRLSDYLFVLTEENRCPQ